MAIQNKRLLRPRNIVIAAIALIALALIAWKVFSPPPKPNYLTAPAHMDSIESAVLATGTIEALRMVGVGAQVSGQIRSLKVELGQRVKKGDLIAEIDSVTQENALRDAEAALLNYSAQLTARQASLRQAELAFKRVSTLLAADAESRENYETAEANLSSSKADVQALQAQITQARIKVDTARANLGYTRIVAPMDGTVVAVLNEEGTTVNANQSTPTIIKLADLDTVTVTAQISEADVTRAKPGQKAWFTILGNPDKRYETRLRAIEPAPDSINSTTTSTTTTTSTSTAIYYNGLLDVPNPDQSLRISMTAQVHIVLDEARNVLTIPTVALGEQHRDGSYTVRVLDAQGNAEPRKIKTGLNNNTSVQVVEGLSEGDKVVLGESAAGAVSTADRRGGRMRPPPM